MRLRWIKAHRSAHSKYSLNNYSPLLLAIFSCFCYETRRYDQQPILLNRPSPGKTLAQMGRILECGRQELGRNCACHKEETIFKKTS